jgi:hypothetical protein
MVLLLDWWVLVKLLPDFCKAALDLDFAELAHRFDIIGIQYGCELLVELREEGYGLLCSVRGRRELAFLGHCLRRRVVEEIERELQ